MLNKTISICAAVAALVFAFALSSCASSGDPGASNYSEHYGHTSGCH